MIMSEKYCVKFYCKKEMNFSVRFDKIYEIL